MSNSDQHERKAQHDPTEHVHRYRCGGCETMVEVVWYDGGGAVGRNPKVRCTNPMCDNDGVLELYDTEGPVA